MNNGWIKLHRKVLDGPLAKRPAWAWLWVTLLLLANHDDRNKFIWMGKEMEQKAGEFITGRKALSEKTGIPQSTIEDILTYLENSCQIRQQKTTKYRLITIVKWKEYQESDNKATAKQQQSDTIKKLRSKEEDKSNPEGLKEKVVYTQEGAEILKAFEEIDPKNKRYYANKTQRGACDFLIKEYGKDRVLWVVKHLPVINKQQYVKKTYTPYQLQENWQSIKDHLEGLKIKNINKVAFT
jgi:hypothetical protein